MKDRASDVLGSTFYLARIRSLAMRAYALQIAVMVGMGFFLSLVQGAKFKPFYFPLEYFMYVVYIMLFAMFLESFSFIMLEIKNQDTDSAKFFTAKKSASKALKIMLIALIILIILANPIAEKQLEGVSARTYTLELKGGNATMEISSVDRFGLMHKYAVIEGKTYHGDYDAYLIYSSYYSDNMSNPAARSRLKFINQSSEKALSVNPPDSTYEEYEILIHTNGNGSFTVRLYNDVTDSFVIYTGVFVICTAILYAWWYVFMQKRIKMYGTELVSD